jgi:biotin carboxylase
MTPDLQRNVFVVGLDDTQRGALETITDASGLAFHQLLDPQTVTHPEHHGFTPLLERAREQLGAFEGSVDALIAHWDFPTSVLVPILGAEFGMPAPSLASVLACEHKLWSRIAQSESIEESVPGFSGFDPFADDALEQITLDFPFWIKPVKSHSSQLGFRIDSAEDFHAAIPRIREGIRDIGDPFNEALALADLPDAIAKDSGTSCIAEEIMAGDQATIEGTMFEGEFNVHGVFDSPKDEHGNHFDRYDYPASLPDEIRARMESTAEAYLRHIGYDNACFNVEFMWDQDADRICVVEVNTRISQSHSDLCAKVDGMSNHEAAVSIALGTPPLLPHRRGPFAVAAKCFLYTEPMTDGIVRRAPSEQEIAAVVERFPGTLVDIEVQEGDRLSELSHQSSYRYDLGTLSVGAQDRDELADIHETCRQMLPFEIEPLEQ